MAMLSNTDDAGIEAGFTDSMLPGVGSLCGIRGVFGTDFADIDKAEGAELDGVRGRC